MCYHAAVLLCYISSVKHTKTGEIIFVPQQGSPGSKSSGIAEKTKDLIRMQCSLRKTIENMLRSSEIRRLIL